MAFKIADGFDHYNSTSDFLARSQNFLQWQTPYGSAPTISFVSALNPTATGKAVSVFQIGLSTPTTAGLRGVWATRNAEMFIGSRVFLPNLTAAIPCTWYVKFMDTTTGGVGTPQVTFKFNPSNYSVQAIKGDYTGTSLALSANNVWTGDTVQFIEFNVKIDGSAGIVDVRINGVSVFGGPVTGLNTLSSANAWSDAIDMFPCGAATEGTYFNLDDEYYCDTTSDPGASPNNTFLGDIGTRTLFATGNGTVQWTPLANTNWQEVSEQAMDSDTSYNSTATPGNEDRLTFQPMTNITALIVAVQVTIAARKDDVGPRVLKTGVDSGGTVSYGVNHPLNDTYAYFTDSWILDPNTSMNWTRTAVNALLGIYNLVS